MFKMVHNLSSRLFGLFFKEKQSYLRRFHHNKTYKVLFFGSDGIALSSLRKINEFRKCDKRIIRLDLVTANSSKNKTIIEKYAHTEDIKTISWPLHSLKSTEYDIGLIVAFGHLIKDDILNKFPLGMVNVHPSLLPRWRGAAPIIHTLLHGDKVTGVSLMKIKANVFDVGEIISQTRVPVPDDIKLPELTAQLSELGADMLVDCMSNLPTSLEKAQPQNEEGVTYAKKINKDISEVRWPEMSSTEVYNLYRAIYGLYPLTTKFRDKQMKLFDAFLHKTQEFDHSKPVGSLEYCEETNAIKVLCKDRRYVYFRSLRIVGKREISALDFYNGYIKNMPVEKRLCMVC
ncbi:methionyl-tRNA formyltransferase, mitochondrial [Pectinophora gossypiella]|uniref:methionyl-tRNA formyltransferase, mitochondrial n=1 Tax=Pectinophora gossypiella TaxID=13191 RepID=UPI00214EF80F|nr:methionyl-tRNA formyltransferase, mitochondrial [Pectinophora gossypiella]